jgi:hypothetical protein
METEHGKTPFEILAETGLYGIHWIDSAGPVVASDGPGDLET